MCVLGGGPGTNALRTPRDDYTRGQQWEPGDRSGVPRQHATLAQGGGGYGRVVFGCTDDALGACEESWIALQVFA